MAYPDHFDSRIERKIIDRVITEALAKDWSISIYDGEEWSLGIPSRDREKITEQIAATEATVLHFWYVREKVGWVALIHGNDEDVIHDWGHAFPEFKPIMNELCREWEEPAPPQHIMDAVHALEPTIYLPLLRMREVVNTVLEAVQKSPAPEAHTKPSDGILALLDEAADKAFAASISDMTPTNLRRLRAVIDAALPPENRVVTDVEPVAYAYYWPDGGLMDVLLTGVAPYETLRQVPLYPSPQTNVTTQMMPKEPTPEILRAFDIAAERMDQQENAPIHQYRREVYLTMLEIAATTEGQP